MATATRELSWTPVSRGIGARTTYCSPACGAGCTKKQYESAKARAEDARLKMRDPSKWNVKVWENMGWFCSLDHIAGGMSVKIDAVGKYWCLFTSSGHPGSGESFWTPRTTATFSSPQDAVDEQLTIAQAFVDKCQVAINAVREEA
jgi:hypothetical protein